MTAKTNSAMQRPAKARAKIGRGTKARVEPSALARTLSPAKPDSKTARVLALISRAEGATLPEIINLTGWQPHSARAALTGLRKKGHKVERTKRDDATCYRITITPRP
jgi:DNA-binding MarR family transcriptional regulator